MSKAWALHLVFALGLAGARGAGDAFLPPRCRLPTWSRFARSVFNDVPPSYINSKWFDVVTDRHSEDYCRAFADIEASPACGKCPGPTLFGDRGHNETGLGGIHSFAVVKVKPGAEVNLYGTRADQGPDLLNPWFMDETALLPSVSFLDYSNERAATCWTMTTFVKCRMKAGATIVMGSGAWRNTTISGCTMSGAQGIKEIQAPLGKYMQYIFSVNESASECWYYDIDEGNLWNSTQGSATQFWPPTEAQLHLRWLRTAARGRNRSCLGRCTVYSLLDIEHFRAAMTAMAAVAHSLQPEEFHLNAKCAFST